jgi:hypothetical protein
MMFKLISNKWILSFLSLRKKYWSMLVEHWIRHLESIKAIYQNGKNTRTYRRKVSIS